MYTRNMFCRKTKQMQNRSDSGAMSIFKIAQRGLPVRSFNGKNLVDLSGASRQRVTLCWDAPNIWSFSIFSCKSNQSPFHIKSEKAKIWYTPNFICHLIYHFPIFSNINHINHTSESYYEQMFASTNIKKHSNVWM